MPRDAAKSSPCFVHRSERRRTRSLILLACILCLHSSGRSELILRRTCGTRENVLFAGVRHVLAKTNAFFVEMRKKERCYSRRKCSIIYPVVFIFERWKLLHSYVKYGKIQFKRNNYIRNYNVRIINLLLLIEWSIASLLKKWFITKKIKLIRKGEKLFINFIENYY